ncbi:hypothetical protein [Nitratireductor basaltis]|uniref:Transmembrane protein n=1 Tax=Nitratireductor basaltis TaxID=472175 RepID=A0A084U643_9HYPH|nr:hypothetical protein [Nitratireductor basaltis]KFB08429.1 hypothetical protein EL18_02680 [Nitratireductor basaltis]
MIELAGCSGAEVQDIIPVAICLSEVASAAITRDPVTFSAVGVCILLTLLLGRSLAITLSVLLAAIVLWHQSENWMNGPEMRLVSGALLAALLLLWLGLLNYRRLFRRQRKEIAALVSANDATQERLDREITWRRAAEPVEQEPEEPGS